MNNSISLSAVAVFISGLAFLVQALYAFFLYKVNWLGYILAALAIGCFLLAFSWAHIGAN